jgi:hypothetical protein
MKHRIVFMHVVHCELYIYMHATVYRPLEGLVILVSSFCSIVLAALFHWSIHNTKLASLPLAGRLASEVRSNGQ